MPKENFINGSIMSFGGLKTEAFVFGTPSCKKAFKPFYLKEAITEFDTNVIIRNIYRVR